MKDIKIIVTLGPATHSKQMLQALKDRGVDFVRVNMSHSSIEELEYFIALAEEIGIPFVLDTEGSQIRSGDLVENTVRIEEGADVRLWNIGRKGDAYNISITPSVVLEQLAPGDILYVDFGTLILRTTDIATLKDGFIMATTMAGGSLGKNKGIAVDSANGRTPLLPTLTKKDYEAIEVGLRHGVGTIAASFMRNGEAVEEVRRATKGAMRIMSKIECIDGLNNLDEIIQKSDCILIDRGDLSKEIPIQKIPIAQKTIINKALLYGKEVFVATNLLETMVEKQKPTRAEVHDIAATILDGAAGLALAAETAIGSFPLESVTMLRSIIRSTLDSLPEKSHQDIHWPHIEPVPIHTLIETSSGMLVPPHGGVLVNRLVTSLPSKEGLEMLPRIILNPELQMDVEQIGIGTFSPLTGFMCRDDFQHVRDEMRLENGLVWPLPIVLDVSEEKARELSIGGKALLMSEVGEKIAILHTKDIYRFDKKKTAERIYGTASTEHPGVRMISAMQPVLIGGDIDLLRRRVSETSAHELTPRQVRRLFEERSWSRVVGFHTRNVIHRGHEYIQLEGLKRGRCDGLFVHPVIGKKKPGDFHARYIIKAYQTMVQSFYPKDRVVFSTYATFSRYAGPREALFTALCRKNFGCSHFVVGRDHTGVGSFYDPLASHEIFDRFENLDIEPIRFDKVFYSKTRGEHIEERDTPNHPTDDQFHISGTEARALFERGEAPPEWFMRPEIAQIILDAIKNKEEVFVRGESA